MVTSCQMIGKVRRHGVVIVSCEDSLFALGPAVKAQVGCAQRQIGLVAEAPSVEGIKEETDLLRRGEVPSSRRSRSALLPAILARGSCHAFDTTWRYFFPLVVGRPVGGRGVRALRGRLESGPDARCLPAHRGLPEQRAGAAALRPSR